MRARIEPQEVAADEMVAAALLRHADAIEAIALGGAHIVVAEEIVRAGRRDRDHLRAGRKAAHVFVVAVEADEIAADRGGRQQRRVEIGVDAVRRSERHLGRGCAPSAAATSPAVMRRRTTAPSASRSSQDMRRYCSRLSVGSLTCGSARRARSTSRAASATAPRIARAVTVAPATKSGMQRRRRAAAERGAGLARQERVELRLADRVVRPR